MSDVFANVYDDEDRAAAYSRLEFPATYYLGFRDLPMLIKAHVKGTEALDFGCGAGRSTRFLASLRFDRIVGVDISVAMIGKARVQDPGGDYRLLEQPGLEVLDDMRFDLVLSAFTFDNVATDRKEALFRALGERLQPGGKIINLVSAPEIYLHEWASFSTRDFTENRTARSGDIVRIVMLDVDDRRPVDDVLCTEDDYRQIYARAGLRPVEVHRPLGRADEPFVWVHETEVSPWAIYVLESAR